MDFADAMPTEADPSGSASPARVREGASATPAEIERFRAVVDTQYDFTWRSLRRLGVHEAAVDDAAQQVFWILSNKLGGLAPGCERTFLFRTALGVAANARRSARLHTREVADGDVVARSPAASPTPEDLVHLKQARRILDDILDGMDPDYRAVFVLAELEGLTVPAIAELLEIAGGTAASRLRRAREMFEKALARFHAKERFETPTIGGGK
jgi:RNA polymerase sigma-70 factor, ECF subfamily